MPAFGVAGVGWATTIVRLSMGAPVGAQFGMEVVLFSFAAVMMGWLGAVELAAHHVTIKLIGLYTPHAEIVELGGHCCCWRRRSRCSTACR